MHLRTFDFKQKCTQSNLIILEILNINILEESKSINSIIVYLAINKLLNVNKYMSSVEYIILYNNLIFF